MSLFLRRNHTCLLLSLAWITVQLPFLSSAFRIDEPYFLSVAKQISLHPLDPYGFRINWDGTPEWAYKTLANPPLVPAYLAAWHKLFPWNEIASHLAMFPFSLIALYTIGILSSWFKVDPLKSATLLACSPGFFLGSQVVMQDVPMLSLFLLAVSYAILYEERGGQKAFIGALLSALLCPLAKYNGLVLVPVLVGILLLGKRKAGLATVASAPLISLLLWNGFTWAKYGTSHFLAMAAFENNPIIRTHIGQILVGVLVATGLGVVPISLLAFILRERQSRRHLFYLAVWFFPLSAWFAARIGYGGLPSVLFAFSTTLSLHLISLTLIQGWKILGTKNRKEWILVLWIICGLVFQGGLLFTSVRYVLYLAPPAILLILSQSSWIPRPKTLAILILVNLCLVIAIAYGDLSLADSYRELIAQKVFPRLQNHQSKFYFSGHWGFQYYSEQIGGEAIDKLYQPNYQEGDLIVIAKSAWPDILEPQLQKGLQFQTEVVDLTSSYPLRTVDCNSGANFYGNRIPGCNHPTYLPFGIGSGPSETCFFFFIKKVPGTAEAATKLPSYF